MGVIVFMARGTKVREEPQALCYSFHRRKSKHWNGGMKRVFSALLLGIVCLALASCGGQAHSNPGVNITGNWNVVFTQNGDSAPSYTFGMNFSRNVTVIVGSEVPYTGGTVYNNGCINYGKLNATGNTNGGSVITMTITDSSTNSQLTISGTANANVTQINGTFNATFGANGSSPACAAQTGTVEFTRQ